MDIGYPGSRREARCGERNGKIRTNAYKYDRQEGETTDTGGRLGWKRDAEVQKCRSVARFSAWLARHHALLPHLSFSDSGYCDFFITDLTPVPGGRFLGQISTCHSQTLVQAGIVDIFHISHLPGRQFAGWETICASKKIKSIFPNTADSSSGAHDMSKRIWQPYSLEVCKRPTLVRFPLFLIFWFPILHFSFLSSISLSLLCLQCLHTLGTRRANNRAPW